LTLRVARQDVEVRPDDQLYVDVQQDGSRGAILKARLASAEDISLRWRTKPTSPEQVEAVLYGEVRTLVSVEEQLLRVTTIVDYRIAQGEAKELAIRLPPYLNVLNVRGPGIDDWRIVDAQDHKMLTAILGGPLADTGYRLMVDGEQSLDGAETFFALPAIQLVGVKQERGYLSVSRTGNIELSADTIEGSSRIDVKELPVQLQAPAGIPAMLAFKYHRHPYRVVLGVTRHQDHAVLAAIAERGELATVISQQGELLTRAAYLIKANKQQFLDVTLPEGAVLWSCLVNGRSMKPAKGTNGELLVPIETLTNAMQAVPMEIVYFERRPKMTGVGQFILRGPVLSVPTTVANWSVYAPRDLAFLKISGNLERGAASPEFVSDPFATSAFAHLAPYPGAQPVAGGSVVREGDNSPAAYLQSLLARRRRAAQKQAADAQSSWSASGLFGVAGTTDEPEPNDSSQREDRTGRMLQQEDVAKSLEKHSTQMQEAGILPLKISLPKSGRAYRFSRLMTIHQALELRVTYVHVRTAWVPLGSLGALVTPVGAILIVGRFARL
jgi:hypothetical protein